MSFKEQRELEQLPQQLEQLEAEIETLQTEVGSSEFFQKDHQYTSDTLQRLAEKEQQLEQCLERWEILENMNSGSV